MYLSPLHRVSIDQSSLAALLQQGPSVSMLNQPPPIIIADLRVPSLNPGAIRDVGHRFRGGFMERERLMGPDERIQTDRGSLMKHRISHSII